MKVDKELIEHVAALARLKLKKEEIDKFTPQLKEVLDVFTKLNEVDTHNVEPSFQPVEIKNVLRKDVPRKCLTQEEALSPTIHKKDGYFKGPKAV